MTSRWTEVRAALPIAWLALLSACGAAGSGAATDGERTGPVAPVSLEQRLDGAMLRPQSGTASALVQAAQVLLAGCTDRERRLLTQADWEQAAGAPSALVLRFEPAVELVCGTRGPLPVEAVCVLPGQEPQAARLLVVSGGALLSAFIGAAPEEWERLVALIRAAGHDESGD